MDHRYRSMDLLRAVAILLVLLAHTVLSYGAPAHLAPLQLGGSGVDLFFVLSGWLLGSQLFKEIKQTNSIDVKRFWIRRWMRTLPAYYVVLIFSVAQRLLTKENVEFPFSYFIFIQNYNYPLEFFSVSWSLCVEEQFYLFIAPLLLLLMRFSKNSSLFILCFLLVSPLLFRELGLYSSNSETHVAMDGCIMGVLLAYIRYNLESFWEKLKAISLPLFLLTLGSYIFFYYARYNPDLGISDPNRLFQAFLFGSWVLFANSSQARQRLFYIPGSKYIATRAYSLYLLHPEILALLRRFSSEMIFPLYFALALIGSICIAEILYRFVEKPIMDRRENFSLSK